MEEEFLEKRKREHGTEKLTPGLYFIPHRKMRLNAHNVTKTTISNKINFKGKRSDSFIFDNPIMQKPVMQETLVLNEYFLV